MAFEQKAWTRNHEKKKIWLFNDLKKDYPDIVIDTFIDVLKFKIKDIINNHPKWSSSSKEGMVFLCARYFYNKQDPTSLIFTKEGNEYMKKNKDNDGKNELDERELESLKDYEIMLELFNKKNNSFTNIDKHYQYLFFALLILQPPLRCSFYCNLKIIYDLSTIDNNENYIYFDNISNKISYIVNNDKVSKVGIFKKNSHIEIENEQLKKLLLESIEHFKRGYLFEINKKPILYVNILSNIREITGIPKITINNFRASYISYFYKHNLSFGSREKIAIKMRHSIITAQRCYNKIALNKFFTEGEKVKSLEDENFKLKSEIIELKNIIQELEKGSNNIVDTEHLLKKRKDVIYNLNIRKIQAKESSFKTYNITYDEIKKCYV